MLRDGTIVIRLARGLARAEEDMHVASLLKRMAKAYTREAAKIRLDPFRPLFENSDSVILDLTTGSTISFRMVSGAKTKAMRTQDGWSVVRAANCSDARFHRFLWKLLSASVKQETEELVRRINSETYDETVRSVTVKFMRSRWGSCSHEGIIALSTPLLLTSPEILRYVIIHELAHIRHPNHSKSFWQHVSVHDPDFAQRRRLLLQYRLPRGEGSKIWTKPDPVL